MGSPEKLSGGKEKRKGEEGRRPFLYLIKSLLLAVATGTNVVGREIGLKGLMTRTPKKTG